MYEDGSSSEEGSEGRKNLGFRTIKLLNKKLCNIGATFPHTAIESNTI